MEARCLFTISVSLTIFFNTAVSVFSLINTCYDFLGRQFCLQELRFVVLFAGAFCGGRVRCPWHGACFNVKTGDIEDFPGLDSIPTFEVG